MILYHGTNCSIDKIDLNKCRPYKDFGKGFYLTTIREQAEKMAHRVARIYGGEPTVNVYEFDGIPAGLKVKRFESPTQDWAMFVMNKLTKPIEYKRWAMGRENSTLHEADIRKSYEVLDAHFARAESKLKTARKRCGLTQEALAHESGVSLNTIRAYERKSKDLNKASFEIVVRLARALRCDVAELID